MLTDNEKVWLKCRGKSYGHYCTWCDLWCDERGANPFCPTTNHKEKFADAAEFSERVAAKLADPTWAVCRHGDSCIEHGGDKEDAWIWLCEVCRIKYARLQVEEEMDDA